MRPEKEMGIFNFAACALTLGGEVLNRIVITSELNDNELSIG